MTTVDMAVMSVMTSMKVSAAMMAPVSMTAAGVALVEVTPVRVMGMAPVAVVGGANGGIHIIFDVETVRSA